MRDSLPSFSQLLERRMSRRDFLQHSGAAVLGGVVASSVLGRSAAAQDAVDSVGGQFTEISKNVSASHRVAPNHVVDVVARWGDHLISPWPFDIYKMTADEQKWRFGYNNDYIAYLPMQRGGESSSHGLLCINHEYTNAALMFPPDAYSEQKRVAIEMNAHGCSIIEVKKQSGHWSMVLDSPYARRITTHSAARFSGPARGHAHLRTLDDPEGEYPKGTLANCGGGITPWGTVLTCEENFDAYFVGRPSAGYVNYYERYGIGEKPTYAWYKYDKRFNLAHERFEPNRFGWVVEYDPYDPHAPLIKHTALGRFKHESATVHQNPDGRIIVYSGDDQASEYLYRYVSNGAYHADMTVNEARRLLEDGVLYVARFAEDGTMRWLPLVHGQGKLTAEHGFPTQAEILIYTRLAADVVGATPMDRPEDVEVHPKTGSVFVALTMNKERKEISAANERAPNLYGHIIELIAPSHALGGKDHTAEIFTWEVFLLGGNPEQSSHNASYLSPVSEQGWLANPDNLACDNSGRLWICTDGQYESIGANEGVYAADVDGSRKGSSRLFFTAPKGAEVTGPCFTPDGTTLFLSVQHPGEGSPWGAFTTTWPDLQNGVVPRPSVIAITHRKDKPVGSA
ncbi:MAG: PhoX family phosphatase [Alphaproteobacteria bacterium]|nr:MAG: PhoX family phosphatase [Alphaproteobacteria bacterium]TAF41466.1 MAG: PhoX family phosphatase [Alphaproteobacteria bacterium]TAF75716.1 MAG: PhoX family phosphatase [Alphaproteobacteria bacterium]